MKNKEKLHNIVGVDGQNLSPILPKEIKNYLIDIDGTVTEDVPNEEPERMLTCLPFPDALKVLNNGTMRVILLLFHFRTEEHREYTERWLKCIILNIMHY